VAGFRWNGWQPSAVYAGEQILTKNKKVTDKKGRTILLSLDSEYDISVYHNDTKLGAFSFDYREGAAPDDMGILATSMLIEEVDGYKNHGIGTEIIRWMQLEQGLPVIFADDNGYEREDGAHLIGDGPGFAASINRKQDEARKKYGENWIQHF